MKTYTVFYAGLLYGEYDREDWPGVLTLPDGSYILYCTTAVPRNWWLHSVGNGKAIKLEDVPNELRAMALLMQ